MAKSHVLIAGAGIGGLTAALALLERGIKVSVFERVAQLREIGAGFHCTPNGTRVLKALGLGPAIDGVGVRLAERDIRLWNTGRAWLLPGHGSDSERRYGAPYMAFHRGDLHSILAQEVMRRQPDAVHLNANVVAFRQDADGVELELENKQRFKGD